MKFWLSSVLTIIQWAIQENIHTPPMDDANIGTQKLQDFQEKQHQFMQDSKPC